MNHQVKSRNEYLLVRSKAESERLELQYKSWQTSIGYVLHPTIQQHSHMRIADVGAGTGIWLRELAQLLPENCQLEGFDISDAMFPNKEDLPSNISFFLHNLLEPFPAEFIGQYDVVNIRLMVVALSAGEWEPAVRNLMSLLKPGGYLQWVDCAAHECVIKGVQEGKEANHAFYFHDLFCRVLNSLGKTPNVAALHGIFQDSGLEACEEHIITLDKPSARTDLCLTVVDGITNCLIAAFKLHKLDQGATTAMMSTSYWEGKYKSLEENHADFDSTLHENNKLKGVVIYSMTDLLCAFYPHIKILQPMPTATARIYLLN